MGLIHSRFPCAALGRRAGHTIHSWKHLQRRLPRLQQHTQGRHRGVPGDLHLSLP